MLYEKYITPKKMTKAQPSSGTLNIRKITRDVSSIPLSRYGLNFPHLVLVFSMMLPMTGSLSASKTLAPIIMAVTAASCEAFRFCVKRMNVRRKFVTRA